MSRTEVKRCAGAVAAVACVCAALAAEARGQPQVAGGGYQVFDSRWNGEAFPGIAAGHFPTLALRGDGSLVAFGRNFSLQSNVARCLPA